MAATRQRPEWPEIFSGQEAQVVKGARTGGRLVVRLRRLLIRELVRWVIVFWRLSLVEDLRVRDSSREFEVIVQLVTIRRWRCAADRAARKAEASKHELARWRWCNGILRFLEDASARRTRLFAMEVLRTWRTLASGRGRLRIQALRVLRFHSRVCVRSTLRTVYFVWCGASLVTHRLRLNRAELVSWALRAWARLALLERAARLGSERAKVRSSASGRAVFRLGRAAARLGAMRSASVLRLALRGWRSRAEWEHETRTLLAMGSDLPRRAATTLLAAAMCREEPLEDATQPLRYSGEGAPRQNLGHRWQQLAVRRRARELRLRCRAYARPRRALPLASGGSSNGGAGGAALLSAHIGDAPDAVPTDTDARADTFGESSAMQFSPDAEEGAGEDTELPEDDGGAGAAVHSARQRGAATRGASKLHARVRAMIIELHDPTPLAAQTASCRGAVKEAADDHHTATVPGSALLRRLAAAEPWLLGRGRVGQGRSCGGEAVEEDNDSEEE